MTTPMIEIRGRSYSFESAGEDAAEARRRHAAATARWQMFAALPEAARKEGAALALANHSTCTVEEARVVLRACPPERQG